MNFSSENRIRTFEGEKNIRHTLHFTVTKGINDKMDLIGHNGEIQATLVSPFRIKGEMGKVFNYHWYFLGFSIKFIQVDVGGILLSMDK